MKYINNYSLIFILHIKDIFNNKRILKKLFQKWFKIISIIKKNFSKEKKIYYDIL